MFKKISLIKTKYMQINRRINDVSSFKTILKATLGALLVSVVIISIPALLIYNLFVFHKIILFLKILIVLLVWFFSFIYNYVYDLLLKNYHSKLALLKTKTLVITDSVGASIILTIFTIVIMKFI